jgi:AsmA protein
LKTVKYTIYVLLALLGLAVAGAAVFALTFDPNRYKEAIERSVKERTGRTLKLSGDLAVAFYPSLGAKLGGATFSERGSDAEFLALDSAHASVALLPLLRGEVIVDGVSVAGLKARVVKDKDGRFNFQDLLGEEKPASEAKPAPEKSGEPVKFDIAGVTVERSAVSYRDLASGQVFALDDLNLSVGRIAERADGKLQLSLRARGGKSDQPAVDAKVELASGYRFDLPAKAFALSGLAAKISGAAAGLTDLRVDAKGDVAADLEKSEYRVSGLDVQFKGMKDKDALAAKLAAPSLVITADSAKGDAVNAEFRLKGENRSADVLMKLSGVQGYAKALLVPQFSADVAITDPSLPMKSVKIPVTGSLRANLDKRTAEADLKARIDESNLQAKLGLAKFSRPAYRFDVNIDQLNLDRYFPPEKAPASGAAGPSKTAAATPDPKIDLSALKGLDANGKIQLGTLQARGLKLAHVKAEVRAADGRVEVAPHSAELYGGSVAGALALQAGSNRVSVKEKLANINIGPLLRDFAQLDRLDGRGNLSLDVATAGATVEAMKKAVDGTAHVGLRDGAIKGIDIAGALRKAKSALGREPAQAASQTERTDFSELSASFAIKNGVAHNEDLDVKAPLFRLTGKGDIDVGTSRIDYVTKVAVVGTTKGQGGAELAELRGLSVPVHLSGPFDNLAYKVDYSAVAADLAKSRAGEKLKGRVEEGREKLEKRLDERLGDKLKGLITR